jgi:hypothetical protein
MPNQSLLHDEIKHITTVYIAKGFDEIALDTALILIVT